MVHVKIKQHAAKCSNVSTFLQTLGKLSVQNKRHLGGLNPSTFTALDLKQHSLYVKNTEEEL